VPGGSSGCEDRVILRMESPIPFWIPLRRKGGRLSSVRRSDELGKRATGSPGSGGLKTQRAQLLLEGPSGTPGMSPAGGRTCSRAATLSRPLRPRTSSVVTVAETHAAADHGAGAGRRFVHGHRDRDLPSGRARRQAPRAAGVAGLWTGLTWLGAGWPQRPPGSTGGKSRPPGLGQHFLLADQELQFQVGQADVQFARQAVSELPRAASHAARADLGFLDFRQSRHCGGIARNRVPGTTVSARACIKAERFGVRQACGALLIQRSLIQADSNGGVAVLRPQSKAPEPGALQTLRDLVRPPRSGPVRGRGEPGP